jgi:hypothetical protein
LSKKGQIGIQETMLVIFVFFIILIIGMILFFRFSISSSEAEIEEYNDFKFKQLIDVVPNMPEIKYSRFGIEDVWCIDLLKARAFSEISDRYDFGFKRITINSSETIILYDNPSRRGEIRKVNSPVCLYDSRVGRFGLANLIVEWWT